MAFWNAVRIILFPLAVCYDAITRLRNHLFNIGYKSSFEFETVIISVGNLSVGGSGKTPLTEYLIRLLKNSKKVVTLSRGYGRRTKGFRLATDIDTAATLGDEPFQFHLKFKENIKVTVGEDRALAIPNILHANPETDVILMDDAFQHRYVKPQLSILVTDYGNPFYTDRVLPSGRLREARVGAKRADLVVVTKCPDNTNGVDFDCVSKNIRRYAGEKPIFFSAIKYGQPISFGKNTPITTTVILISGIANSANLLGYVKSHFRLIKHFEFTDHHHYTSSDLVKLTDFMNTTIGEVTLLTTEKDMTKLVAKEFDKYRYTNAWFYLPIETYFLKDGEKFDTHIFDKL